MRRLLLLAMLAPPSAYAQVRPAAVDSAVRLIQAYMASGHIPGMSAAIAMDGRMVWSGSFGFADLEHQVPVNDSTLFLTASVLKPITAVAVFSLVQARKLDLDQPIQRYCPAFPSKPWPVTARQLLLHQAGIRASSGADVFNRVHVTGVAEAVARFANDTLQFQPGSSVLYSNDGYTLLACAIEGASGESYDAYLKHAILDPARMHHTLRDETYRVIPNMARGYLVRTADNTRQWQGLWTAAHLAETTLDVPAPADPLDTSPYIGAGNYRSTPSDLIRFALALEQGTLLSDSLRALLYVDAPVAGRPSGRTLGDWLVDGTGDQLTARVLGSVWTGSFGVMTMPARRVTVVVASNVEFNQPAGLMRQIMGLLAARP